MKVIKTLIAVSGTVLIFVACSKSNDVKEEQKQPELLASKEQVAVNTPITFSLQNAPKETIAKWSANSSLVTIDSTYSRQQSTMTFAAPGVYTIDVELKKVMCSLEAAANPGMDTCFNAGKPASSLTRTILVKE